MTIIFSSLFHQHLQTVSKHHIGETVVKHVTVDSKNVMFVVYKGHREGLSSMLIVARVQGFVPQILKVVTKNLVPQNGLPSHLERYFRFSVHVSLYCKVCLRNLFKNSDNHQILKRFHETVKHGFHLTLTREFSFDVER